MEEWIKFVLVPHVLKVLNLEQRDRFIVLRFAMQGNRCDGIGIRDLYFIWRKRDAGTRKINLEPMKIEKDDMLAILISENSADKIIRLLHYGECMG